MRLIGLAVILTAGLTLTPLAAEAESAGKVYRIGFILTAAPDEAGHLVKALDEGLRELGYVIAAVKQATAKIPVVMAASRDPVGSGFIASVARPGGNITGLANDPAPEILGKNLELLKEAIPRASRVALLWNPVPPGAGTYRNAVESAARKLGVPIAARRGPWTQRLRGRVRRYGAAVC